jgi:outer membrane receptor protein involved in Fe transport
LGRIDEGTSSYLQTDFKGELGGMPYSGNVGARLIHTDLDVTQYLTGLPGQYGTEPADAGDHRHRRSYNDVLPAANFALNVTDKFTVRLSASKNMMPLDLSQWGGGLALNYSLLETKTGPIYQVATGSSAGNPNLNPWRSTNLRGFVRVLHQSREHGRPRAVPHQRAELHRRTAA